MTSALPPIRDARDSDSQPLAALIAASFADYPNCLFDWSEFPELRAPASHFAAKGGRLWVADAPGGDIAGSLGVVPVAGRRTPRDLQGLCRPGLSRHRAWRRRCSPGRSPSRRTAAVGEMMLWSDSRFTRGHRFYEKLGFVRWPGERYLADVSATWEYHFRKPLPPGSDAGRTP